MNRKVAKEKINQYFKAWLIQDLSLLLSVIDENTIIKECYGPIYQGKKAIEKWFKDWHSGTNKVLMWEITSFIYDSDLTQSAVEWNFKCLFDGKECEFYGSSIITFKGELINSLNEYEMKKDQYYPYN
jgi:hypothetical protein